ncbi:MAG: hypothetical protein GY940_25190 [bacterium]|nr:hypothetical protein [bacterium]
MKENHIIQSIKANLDQLHPDSVVNIRVKGRLSTEVLTVFSAGSLRTIIPGTMNITVNLTQFRRNTGN